MAVVMHVPIIWEKSVVLNLLPLPVFIHRVYNKPQILKREIDVENSFPTITTSYISIDDIEGLNMTHNECIESNELE